MAAVNSPQVPETDHEALPSRRRALFWFVILIAVIAIVAVSLPFISILYTILIPPMPPLPDGGRIELSRENYSYGVDEFRFQTNLEPCSAVAFYQNTDSVCNVVPYQCDGRTAPDGFVTGDTLLARCEGTITIAPFSMEWWVLIVRSRSDPTKAQLSVWREMNWFGAPTVTPGASP
jgi:hypothetical protein